MPETNLKTLKWTYLGSGTSATLKISVQLLFHVLAMEKTQSEAANWFVLGRNLIQKKG